MPQPLSPLSSILSLSYYPPSLSLLKCVYVTVAINFILSIVKHQLTLPVKLQTEVLSCFFHCHFHTTGDLIHIPWSRYHSTSGHHGPGCQLPIQWWWPVDLQAHWLWYRPSTKNSTSGAEWSRKIHTAQTHWRRSKCSVVLYLEVRGNGHP